jgi:hypothetical protein
MILVVILTLSEDALGLNISTIKIKGVQTMVKMLGEVVGIHEYMTWSSLKGEYGTITVHKFLTNMEL